MKVALVHDYLREFGGAERVLLELSNLYPKAPINVSFKVKHSTGEKAFKDRVVNESVFAPILKVWKLYSPLRFMTPLIWWSMNFRKYDIVITSAGWYITRGFRIEKNTKVICYCHTPPRWLYGFETAGRYQKYLPVKIYAKIVGFFLRIYDKWTARQVDVWIANSVNVQNRIKKFYKRDSVVIYPPVEVEKINKATKNLSKEDYFLIVSRLTGAKGIEEAVNAANALGFKLKVVGEASDVSGQEEYLKNLRSSNVELLGRVSDSELYTLYGKAKGFIALARDEDFGITVVEAQAAGTPVIAFNGGGFRESVIEGVTGVFVDDTSVEALKNAIAKISKKKWERKVLVENARRFSKARFKKEIESLVRKTLSS